jgi:hypothetical protein
VTQHLPQGWEIVYRLHHYVKTEVAPHSPIVTADLQILDTLDEAFPTEGFAEFYAATNPNE